MGNYFVAQRRSVLADGEHREGRQNGLSDILDARPTNETVFSVCRLFHPSQRRTLTELRLEIALHYPVDVMRALMGNLSITHMPDIDLDNHPDPQLPAILERNKLMLHINNSCSDKGAPTGTCLVKIVRRSDGLGTTIGNDPTLLYHLARTIAPIRFIDPSMKREHKEGTGPEGCPPSNKIMGVG